MAGNIGKLLQSYTAPPHTCATGKIQKGQILRVIDVEGEQVADFVSIKLNDPTEYLDGLYANFMLERYKWHKGDVIYTNHLNPIWSIVDDTGPMASSRSEGPGQRRETTSTCELRWICFTPRQFASGGI